MRTRVDRTLWQNILIYNAPRFVTILDHYDSKFSLFERRNLNLLKNMEVYIYNFAFTCNEIQIFITAKSVNNLALLMRISHTLEHPKCVNIII